MRTTGDESGEFQIPANRRAHVHVRRGGHVRPEAVARPDAVVDRADVRGELSSGARWSLVTTDSTTAPGAAKANGSDPGLAAAANAHLDGSPTPLGAAAVLRLLLHQEHPRASGVVDAWVAAHGLVFAVSAVAELARVEVVLHKLSDSYKPRWTLRHRAPTARTVPPGEIALVRRARELLAACPEEEHAEAVAALAGSRDTAQGRLAVSYLAPGERGWADEVVTEALGGPMYSSDSFLLLTSVGEADQLIRLMSLGWVMWYLPSPEVLWTALDAMGHGVLPVLGRLLDVEQLSAQQHGHVLEVLEVLPGDEAFALLLPRFALRPVRLAAHSMAARDPERALRLLAAAAVGRPAGSDVAKVLRAVAVKFADLDVSGLPEATRAVLERERAAHRAVPASAEGAPPVLTSPPWAKERRRAARPKVVKGLEPLAAPGLVWEPGEFEAWRSEHFRPRRFPDWEATVRAYASGRLRSSYDHPAMFLHAAERLVRPLLADWKPDPWAAERWGRPLIARFGLDVLPHVVALARSRPGALAELVLPYAAPEVAALVADWLVRLKSARPVARRWLERHGLGAARFLVPVAVGPAGAARRAAEHALRQIPEHAMTAAREHGEQVAGIVAASLAVDPLDVLPVKVPAVPSWLDPDLLPQVLLRGGRAALPEEAARNLLVVLAMSTSDEPYAGLEQVRRACEPASLARFAWAVFDQWRLAGTPSKDGWALTCLGLVGDDEVVRALSPQLRSWPAEGGHARAVLGLDVLARLGTDVALVHLDDVARRVKHKGVRTRAQEKLAEVATSLGLTSDELSDRLVPTFDLAADGTLELDYGPRRFVVGFDEQLKPYVTGPDGKRLKALPKPGARDDAELAPEAHRRFAALKKDVRTAATAQIARLEKAMLAGRSWGAEEFTALFARHPLVWHLARRLVWITESGLAFRLAEDRTLSDLHEEPVELGAGERVALAHPMRLGDDLEAWAELLADYEVLQPFPQLGRPVHRLTAEEAEAFRLTRFQGVVVPCGKVFGLLNKGWEQEQSDGYVIDRVQRPLPDGRAVVVGLDPGVPRGYDYSELDQKTTEVWITDHGPGSWRAEEHRFGTVDPVVMSEVLGDLVGLTR
ncbi:DUF4132 domain-containing protein [Actinosynnema pretiosum]|uniref:DUF4132 domain-containing protein n=1 Tax=Actinosynnema pretiosum TaxID=42197 RepID=A0A290Z3B1_9PSEU|nr:DUF4132 domain-containing protein [Actinosynnema pretiosum]ATE53488.1 hypothetical protein CNX65_09445 [Actinosynnema pretiosum]